jgi:hypothetical protein
VSVFCYDCGDPIKGEPPIADDPPQREPCPSCGSIARRLNLQATAFAGSWGGATLTLAPKTRPASPRTEPPRVAELLVSSCYFDQKAEPPIIPEFLVVLCVNRRYRNGLLQNLEEDFESDLAAGASVKRARRKYWAAALNSIGPRLWAVAKRIGIIGLIADYARRLLQ